MDKNTLSLLVHFLVFTFYFFLLLNPFTILDRSHRNSFSSDMFLKSPRVYFTKKKKGLTPITCGFLHPTMVIKQMVVSLVDSLQRERESNDYFIAQGDDDPIAAQRPVAACGNKTHHASCCDMYYTVKPVVPLSHFLFHLPYL